jgi:HK97 family phage prohead protease
MHRAYSTLEIKAIDESARVLTGIASTPEVDRMGDIVEPKGAEFSLPLPLLWQHDSKQPIGHVTAARVTDKGIEISAQLATVAEAGPLKDRLDNAWQTLKAGLVRGLSIGFQSREVARIENTDGLRFLKWLWLELSAVTIPANQSATISTIKSLDVGCPASEATEITRSLRPASRAAVRLVPRTAAKDPKMPKPLADQIKDLESSRAAKQAALEAIQTKASDEGRTKDAAEK